jgi:gamma-glutamyl-gamma-aminobutyrate hydrolase PuuD
MKKERILGWMPQGTGAAYPFDATFSKNVNVLQKGFDGVDALVLWGGEDISSSYYKEVPHIYNQNHSGVPTQRDINEYKAMVYAKARGIPIIGVCRGAQFLCVFAGGKLVQHVNGHHKTHLVTTYMEEKFQVTSCHHQMMYPFEVPHEMIAWSSDNLSTLYENKSMMGKPEPEIVYFPGVNGLAIQGHPEWAEKTSRFAQYCNELVLEYLFEEELVV